MDEPPGRLLSPIAQRASVPRRTGFGSTESVHFQRLRDACAVLQHCRVRAGPVGRFTRRWRTLLTERRPLFVENAGLFSFDVGLPMTTRGNSLAAEQAFYSRRIGRPPRLAAAEGTVSIETTRRPFRLGRPLRRVRRLTGGRC